MTYKLFLDDKRDPPSDGTTWVVVRSVLAAKLRIVDFGWPKVISFDNDFGIAGLNNEGRGFAKWLIEQDFRLALQNRKGFPDGFDWYVYSQNPIGRDAINHTLNAYFQNKNMIIARLK